MTTSEDFIATPTGGEPVPLTFTGGDDTVAPGHQRLTVELPADDAAVVLAAVVAAMSHLPARRHLRAVQ